jgi:hypothetical protein
VDHWGGCGYRIPYLGRILWRARLRQSPESQRLHRQPPQRCRRTGRPLQAQQSQLRYSCSPH